MISSLLYNLNHAPCWRGEMKVWNRRMRATSLDRLLYLGLHRSGWMGEAERALLRRIVHPGMRVIDVGANVGLYSLLFAELVGIEGSVLAFEPEPNLFAMLQANCARNAACNVSAVQRALGRENRRVIFHRSAFNSGDNRLGARSSAHQPVEVDLVRFDDLEPNFVPDFIKIDVQGHELDALAGMEKALAANRSVRVVFEFSPAAAEAAGGSPGELLEFFAARDFILYTTGGGRPRRVSDFNRLIARVRRNQYINLLASRDIVDV